MVRLDSAVVAALTLPQIRTHQDRRLFPRRGKSPTPTNLIVPAYQILIATDNPLLRRRRPWRSLRYTRHLLARHIYQGIVSPHRRYPHVTRSPRPLALVRFYLWGCNRLEQHGITLSREGVGVSLKTEKRFDRDVYLDATQR